MQAITSTRIEEAADNAESTEDAQNEQSRKPYSDSVILVVCVSSVGLLGAGTYLGITGKLSLKSLLKLLAGRLGL